MTRCRPFPTALSAALLAALLTAPLNGCAAKPKPSPMSMPPTADEVSAIRADFKTTFPDAKIGVVSAVLDSDPYALVGQIDVAAVREGAIISFLDAEQTVIANGTVVKVDPDGLTVKYDAGKRAPKVGDVAVKF